MQHPAHEPFIDPGVTFSDGVDGEGSVVASEEVDIDKPGAYQLTYSYGFLGNPPIFFTTVYVVDQTPRLSLSRVMNPWFMVYFQIFLIQELRQLTEWTEILLI